MKFLNGKIEINSETLEHIYNNYSLYIYGRDKNDEEMRKKYQERLFEDSNILALINGLEDDSEEACELYAEIIKVVSKMYIEENKEDYKAFDLDA